MSHTHEVKMQFDLRETQQGDLLATAEWPYHSWGQPDLVWCWRKIMTLVSTRSSLCVVKKIRKTKYLTIFKIVFFHPNWTGIFSLSVCFLGICGWKSSFSDSLPEKSSRGRSPLFRFPQTALTVSIEYRLPPLLRFLLWPCIRARPWLRAPSLDNLHCAHTRCARNNLFLYKCHWFQN